MGQSVKKVSVDGMKGDYSRYALTQHNAIANGLDRAVAELILPLSSRNSNDTLQIIDLGTADGVNGFPVVTRFAKTVAENDNGLKLGLTVSHVDVPAADFSSLMENVYHRADSYYNLLQQQQIDVQPCFVPGSFYDTYANPDSADIIFATTSLHYASQSVSGVKNHVDPLYAEGEEKTKWQQLGKQDLHSILYQVSRTLKRGGKFWAIVPAHTKNEITGDIQNHWNREVWKIMISQLKEMVKSGELSRKDWEEFTVPVHQRHVEDWKHWFTENSDMLRLEYAETIQGSNPYLDEYFIKGNNRDKFADDYTGFTRAWAERIISSLIPEQNTRDIFFKKIHEEFRNDPERFADDNVSVYIGATRI